MVNIWIFAHDKVNGELLVFAPQLRGNCTLVAEAGTPQKATVTGIVRPSRRRGWAFLFTKKKSLMFVHRGEYTQADS